MAGLTPQAPPLSAQQIAAKLVAAGYTQPQADALSAIYRSIQLLVYALDDQGVELPDELLASLDDFDPDDDQSSIEGMTQ